MPGTFGDPVRIVQSLPGAARAPFGTGMLVLRGANPGDSKVYVDGEDLGRTPLVGHSLEAGEYALRLVVPAAGDKEINETVTVRAGEETRIVKRITVKETSPEE